MRGGRGNRREGRDEDNKRRKIKGRDWESSEGEEEERRRTFRREGKDRRMDGGRQEEGKEWRDSGRRRGEMQEGKRGERSNDGT